MTTMGDALAIYTTQAEMSSFFMDKMRIINVESYSSFQAAIDAASAVGGGYVWGPGGTYRHAGLTWKSNVYFIGAGAKTTVLEYTAATGNGITLPAECSNAGIIGAKLYSSANSTGSAIKDTSGTVREFYIDNYEIEGFKKGIDISVVGSGMNCQIGMGRLIGQGKGVSGGIGINIAGNAVSLYKPYVANYETGIQTSVDGGFFYSPIVETVKDGIVSSSVTSVYGAWISIDVPNGGKVFKANSDSLIAIGTRARDLVGNEIDPIAYTDFGDTENRSVIMGNISTYIGRGLRVEGIPADGGTALLLKRNVGDSITWQPVTMGAADSGGTGYKVLRVPN